MSEMPVILAAAFAVLLGWPLAQVLVLVLVVRPAIRQVRALADALRRDPAYAGPSEQRAIDHLERSAWPTWTDALNVLAPVVLPTTIVVSALAELVGRASLKRRLARAEDHYERLTRVLLEDSVGYPSAGPLWGDARFVRLERLSSDAALARWPVSLVLTLAGLLITVPIWGLVYGFRSSTLLAFRSVAARIHDLGRALPIPVPR